jgi:epoxyqueuosine reductase
MSLKESIKKLAADVGYVACGFTGVEPFDHYRDALRTLEQRFPESAALYDGMERRADPRTTVPWAGSIVVALRRYGRYKVPAGLARHIGLNYLCDRRNGACPDTVMPKRMKEGLKALGLRVKTGGVPARAAAVRAGVAGLARNGFVYRAGCGTWVNVEAWVIDAVVEPDRPAPAAPCPEGCRACEAACRTGALVGPGRVRMDRCVAYLTYGAPWPVAPELWERMGPWIYGCDDCQNACPLNKGCWDAKEPAPWLEAVADRLTPEALVSMDDATYRDVVHPLFWYIDENDLARWHANAKRALGDVSCASRMVSGD